MLFIVDLFYLILCEAMVYVLILSIDYCAKCKKQKAKKAGMLWIKERVIDKTTVSLFAYRLQIFNFIYVFVFLSNAIMYRFCHTSFMLTAVIYKSASFYAAVALVGSCVAAVISLVVEPESQNIKICKELIIPLLRICKKMIADKNMIPLSQSVTSKNVQEQKNAACSILKKSVIPELKRTLKKASSQKMPLEEIGLLCTPLVLDFFDEQSDFVQKILELDKILNKK